MLFVVCFVGSWHVCSDLSSRCLPQFVFVPQAPGTLGATGEGPGTLGTPLGTPPGTVAVSSARTLQK